MATVDLLAVSKSYDHHAILQEINLKVERGEFVAVVGPSGCGKSTLLRLIAGLETLTKGTILINHQCVNKISAAHRDMAMVFQNYALYPHMTAYDNMAYGLKMRGIKKKERHERIMEVSKMLQIDDYLHRKPGMLSGGQRQRVGMGRAIVRSPAVFLFDEPLSNLDAKLRMEMRHEIKNLHKKLKTTCLYVTHDQTEAMTMADRIVVLNKGEIEQVGTPRDLYECPATLFVAGFIGFYPTNFIPAELDLSARQIITNVGQKLPFRTSYEDVSSASSVVLGVRPEHFKISKEPSPMSVLVSIEFIDDLGADKLLQMKTLCGKQRFSVRVSSEIMPMDERLNLEITKATLFCKHTGKRLGGWNEEKREVITTG